MRTRRKESNWGRWDKARLHCASATKWQFYEIINEMLPHASWMHRSAHEYMHERVAFLGKSKN